MKTKMFLAVLVLTTTTGLGSVRAWSPGDSTPPPRPTSYSAPGAGSTASAQSNP